MATLTKIVTGMEKGPEAINTNDVALNADIATLTAGQKLTWIYLPLESGITGNLSVAAAYNGSIVYIKGQVNGNFTVNTLLSKCTGTPLSNLIWSDLTVFAGSAGIQNLQMQGDGYLHYNGNPTSDQINANGLFAK